MPIRTASFKKRLADTGAQLHKAMAQRIHASGPDKAPSEAEKALIEERRLLKEERARRREQALQPSPTALDKLVRTQRPQPKGVPKASKAAKDAPQQKDSKPAKRGPSRADKQAAKESALDAARKATKKSAKT